MFNGLTQLLLRISSYIYIYLDMSFINTVYISRQHFDVINILFTERSGNVRQPWDSNFWRKRVTTRPYSACSRAVPTGTRTRRTRTGSCRISTPCTSGQARHFRRSGRCFRACSSTDSSSTLVIFLRRRCTAANRARDVSSGSYRG